MFTPTPRTIPNRSQARMSYAADVVHEVLDEAYVCDLSFVVDGEPRVLPTLHVRIDDMLYLHGSTGSRPLLAGRKGLRVAVAVTLLDGLVYARSHFHHSANYRSVVAHGVAELVADEAEKRRVLDALVDKVGPGRAADSRPPSAGELARTAVLRLPLVEVAAKVRAGGPNDDDADLDLPHWAGVVPLRLTPGAPHPSTGAPGYLPQAHDQERLTVR
jgi:nitroimidazol reductase NimA-like FMN-containing flavoprotein (pyridoxamine 5'-phosphate oxidase superfamily)